MAVGTPQFPPEEMVAKVVGTPVVVVVADPAHAYAERPVSVLLVHGKHLL